MPECTCLSVKSGLAGGQREVRDGSGPQGPQGQRPPEHLRGPGQSEARRAAARGQRRFGPAGAARPTAARAFARPRPERSPKGGSVRPEAVRARRGRKANGRPSLCEAPAGAKPEGRQREARDGSGPQGPQGQRPSEPLRGPGRSEARRAAARGQKKWRRGRDSNPRDGFPSTPLAGERLRPLGHLSTAPVDKEKPPENQQGIAPARHFLATPRARVPCSRAAGPPRRLKPPASGTRRTRRNGSRVGRGT